MKKYYFTLILASATLVGQYPPSGVYNEIDLSFQQVAALNQQIIDALNTFTTNCCSGD